MKKAAMIIILFFAFPGEFLFSQTFDISTDKFIAMKNANPALPQPAKTMPKAKIKDWTIMVFMNGKNNLSNYALKDLNEMENAGSSSRINIVVEAGRTKYNPPSAPSYPSYPPYNDYPGVYPGGPGIHPHWPPLPPYALNKSGDWEGIRRYYIVKDDKPGTVTSPIVETLSADMGDWKHLAEFGKWVKSMYPAKKYMLIVWNHGDGWKRPDINIDLKGISIDETTGNEISTPDLARALEAMGGVDIYASDACLMQMAEVVYELKDWAPVIIGSEETEPADGWPYGKILSRLSEYRYLRYDWIAKTVAGKYAEDYGAKGKGVTQSAIKAKGLSYVKDMVKDWIKLVTPAEKETLTKAASETLSFKGSGSKDFIHFLSIVSRKAKSRKLRAKSGEIINYLERELIITNKTTGEKYENAHGLAIYLPLYAFDSRYSKLKWSKDTGWGEFLKWLTGSKAPEKCAEPANPTEEELSEYEKCLDAQILNTVNGLISVLHRN